MLLPPIILLIMAIIDMSAIIIEITPRPSEPQSWVEKTTRRKLIITIIPFDNKVFTIFFNYN